MKNKAKLKRIAKRLAKTILIQTSVPLLFQNSGLNEEQISYIKECIYEIANKLTDKEQAYDVDELVKEYFT